MAHITGGGITENLPRVLPAGTRAAIDARHGRCRHLHVAPARGGVATTTCCATFNMGIGLIIVVSYDRADAVLAQLREAGEVGAMTIGSIGGGGAGVVYTRRQR